MRFPVLVAVLCAVIGGTAGRQSYSGYKLYSVEQNNQQQVDFLRELQQSAQDLDFWQLDRLVGSEARVLVPPAQLDYFRQLLKAQKLRHRELIHDFERVQDDHLYGTKRVTPSQGLPLNKYLRYNEMIDYINTLAKKYSSFVTHSSKIEVFSRAESYEGREILTVRICHDVREQKRPNRWCILIDAGIHAREWITVSVALFIVRQLIEKDEISAKSFRSFEWIILPLLNPDGYEYSREHNKMWRKTRRPLGPRHRRSCVGVDCNRNFNVAWTIGSARFCSLLYRGERPFSERETKNVRDLFRKLRPACKFYLSLHSYAKAILYPRAYTRTLPRNWQMQHTIAEAGVEAMKKATGVRYRCGSASTVLNRPVGGSSIDYAHDIEKVPVALVMEVASKGFHPPEANIERICEESWIGIGAMVNCLASSFRSVLKGSGTLHLR
ncbi:AGAP006206-PA [Anopheles gambiae str. PEST]|uniref:AGAP006206-PA n=1 Tax=Anopheles gambiae TaxID=7165 RepID=A7UU51_ANOGA|nr:AGAP006206-PA [Anopheles gambiae str. PEST]